MPSYDDLKTQKQQAFKDADAKGDAITPQQWGHVVGLLQHANVDPQENPQIAQIVEQLSGLLVESKPMSFREMDQYRDAIEATGEPAAEQVVDIIDQSLEGMGAMNPNMKDAVTASKGIRVRKQMAELLKAALSFKEQQGTDMLSAMKQAVDELGIEGLPKEDRKVIQNMLMTGDSTEFASMLDADAGGQRYGSQQTGEMEY